MLQQLHQFDMRLVKLAQRLPRSFHPAMIGCTALGQPTVLLGVIAMFGLFMITMKQTLLAKVSGIVALALLVSPILKIFFQRSRPDIVFTRIDQPKSYSFPSGHAYCSVLVYGFLAYLAFTRLPSPWNIIVAAVLSTLIALISLSRVYLGVHYASDVVVGWILGGIVLMLIIKLSGI